MITKYQLNKIISTYSKNLSFFLQDSVEVREVLDNRMVTRLGCTLFKIALQ